MTSGKFYLILKKNRKNHQKKDAVTSNRIRIKQLLLILVCSASKIVSNSIIIHEQWKSPMYPVK